MAAIHNENQEVNESTFKKIRNALAAQKHRLDECIQSTINTFQQLPEVTRSAHPVKAFLLKGLTFFYKPNPANSMMSELEAGLWSLYHVNSPHRVPGKVRAIFNSIGEYIGVISQGIPNYRSIIKDPFTEKDLANKEIVKGLANILALSYLFQEDDLHRGNMSKWGFRIDFDMSLWPILGYFKIGSITDWIYRPRDAERFVITARDIDNFPDLEDAKPFYWCTVAQKGVSEKVIILTENVFTSTENAAFKKLKNDPVFIREKFKTMLKFLLISTDYYGMLIGQHIRSDLPHPDPELNQRNITDVITDHIDARKRELRNVLVQMPTFREFLWKHGNAVLKEIKHEFAEYNKELTIKETKKWNKDPERDASTLVTSLIYPQDITNAYNSIFKEAKQFALAAPYVATQKLR